jgi:hypothetical protein
VPSATVWSRTTSRGGGSMASVNAGTSGQAATGGRWWGRIGNNCVQYRSSQEFGRRRENDGGAGPPTTVGQYRTLRRPIPISRPQALVRKVAPSAT